MPEFSNDPIRIPIPQGLRENGLATAVANGQEIVILKQDDGYRAVDRWCPHEEGDLGEGMMYGKNIKCPVHGYIFDLTKGQCINQFTMSLAVYDVQLDGEYLLLTQLSETKGREW
jgi:nitrite reductase/ring-hydroxylating ferredoxin subunit